MLLALLLVVAVGVAVGVCCCVSTRRRFEGRVSNRRRFEGRLGGAGVAERLAMAVLLAGPLLAVWRYLLAVWRYC